MREPLTLAGIVRAQVERVTAGPGEELAVVVHHAPCCGFNHGLSCDCDPEVRVRVRTYATAHPALWSHGHRGPAHPRDAA